MEGLVEISVVIPVYGNEKTLAELTSKIVLHLQKITFEIIYVLDASPDHSLEVITYLSTDYPEVKFINLFENIGQQNAILEGMKMAKGEKIVVLDADLQDNPELILALFHMHKSAGDAVFILRKGLYQSFSRMATSIVLKKIIQILSGLNYKAGSYYLTDKNTLDSTIALAEKCPFPYLSIIVAFQASKLRYLPASRADNNGISGYNLAKRLRAGYQAIRCCIFCLLN